MNAVWYNNWACRNDGTKVYMEILIVISYVECHCERENFYLQFFKVTIGSSLLFQMELSYIAVS